MPNALGLAAAALAAAQAALALRLTQEPLSAGPGSSNGVQKKMRQVLYNYMDVQYFGYISLGGQTVKGVLDTGSFDLVVFDGGCPSCGKAGAYLHNESSSFSEGVVEQVMSYGSGDVTVREGFDQVAIGPYSAVNLSFWYSTNADMPVLQNAAFNAIVGVGPPETSGSDAWKIVHDDVEMIHSDLNASAAFPSDRQYSRLGKDTALAAELGLQPTLIKADDISKFSICLGKKAGSAGYITWNDTSVDEYPGAFRSLKVLGTHTWTMNLTNMRLGAQDGFPVGCQDGCGAIIDSGTSLLLMPYDAISQLREHMLSTDGDCDDPRTLPDLIFELDGQEFSLPPDAYLAHMSGSMSSASVTAGGSTFVAERVPLDIGRGSCQLAVMGSSSATRWGPLWILGMPFFRTYYTTFQVGRQHSERRLYVSKASSDCTPAATEGQYYSQRHSSSEESQLHSIDRSAVLAPRIVRKAMTQSYLDDL